MKLLVVTDHRFFGAAAGVYDAYCFGRSFFDDYRAVFDEVRVAARLRRDPPPSTAQRSDGDGVEFVGLPDVQGGRWILAPSLQREWALWRAVSWSDAVCVRIPGRAGDLAARFSGLQRRPLMFEVISDPAATLSQITHGRIVGLVGRREARKQRRIVRASVSGSYVSVEHLQRAFPAAPGTACESISSIRLPAGSILEPRRFTTSPDPLRLVLVASLMPVKLHQDLLRAVAAARRSGARVALDLVGDGPSRPLVESLIGELGLGGVVTVHGHVSDREQLDGLLDCAHLFVMTSASEGMPRAMIEAMARGLPAVGTSTGGIAELLPDDQLVPVGDHEALGGLIADVQRDPARLSRMSEGSIRTALQYEAAVLSARRRRLLGVLRDHANGRAP